MPLVDYYEKAGSDRAHRRRYRVLIMCLADIVSVSGVSRMIIIKSDQDELSLMRDSREGDSGYILEGAGEFH